MDLTTLARVKAHVEQGEPMKAGGSDETQLSALIASYSAAFETRLNRLVLAVERTVNMDVEGQQRIFDLAAYPVTTVTSVTYASDRDFDNGTTIDSDDYYCELATGLLHLEFSYPASPGALKVVYTGGMAADAAAFIAAYPELAAACDIQIAAHYQRRKGLGSHGMNAGAGSMNFAGPVTLLPEVEASLQRHARLTW